MLSKDERETVCVYEEATDTWTIDTTVRKHITKLLRIFDENEIDVIERADDGRIIGLTISGAGKSQVSFRNKPKPMSEEQRRAAAERMQAARNG